MIFKPFETAALPGYAILALSFVGIYSASIATKGEPQRAFAYAMLASLFFNFFYNVD